MFFLWHKRRKERTKETPLGACRSLRRASQGAALTIRELLKKLDQNFWRRLRCEHSARRLVKKHNKKSVEMAKILYVFFLIRLIFLRKYVIIILVIFLRGFFSADQDIPEAAETDGTVESTTWEPRAISADRLGKPSPYRIAEDRTALLFFTGEKERKNYEKNRNYHG